MSSNDYVVVEVETDPMFEEYKNQQLPLIGWHDRESAVKAGKKYLNRLLDDHSLPHVDPLKDFLNE